MTTKNQRKDIHLYNQIAYKNRVGANILENDKPQRDIKSTRLEEFLPNNELVREQHLLVFLFNNQPN